MAEVARRSLGKKLRFEIFARDQYQCRYCGRSPPTIILHVDHVVAVVEGGTDDPENLVTSCSDCNLGKGRIIAPAPPGAPSMKDKLAVLQEAEEQLAEYRAFLEGSRQKEDVALQHVAKYWSSLFSNQQELTQSGLSGLRTHLKHFAPEKVMEAMDIARARKSDPGEHFKYTQGILRNWRRALEDPARAESDKRVRMALAFWKGMDRGGGYVPRGYEREFARALDVLGVERVIDEMKAWGRSSSFDILVGHLTEMLPPDLEG